MEILHSRASALMLEACPGAQLLAGEKPTYCQPHLRSCLSSLKVGEGAYFAFEWCDILKHLTRDTNTQLVNVSKINVSQPLKKNVGRT